MTVPPKALVGAIVVGAKVIGLVDGDEVVGGRDSGKTLSSMPDKLVGAKVGAVVLSTVEACVGRGEGAEELVRFDRDVRFMGSEAFWIKVGAGVL